MLHGTKCSCKHQADPVGIIDSMMNNNPPQVLCFGAAEGEVGRAGGARAKREGGAQPGAPEDSATAAGESTAQIRSGQVLEDYTHHQTWTTPSVMLWIMLL